MASLQVSHGPQQGPTTAAGFVAQSQDYEEISPLSPIAPRN